MVKYIDITKSEHQGLEIFSFGMTSQIIERLLEISFVGGEWEDNGKQIPETSIFFVAHVGVFSPSC